MLSFKPGWVFSHKQKDKTPQCHGAHSLVQLLKSCLVMSDSMQTPWGLAYQAPLFMGFSRQEYWRGLPFLPPGDLPDPGIEPKFPTLRADALPSEPPGKPSNTMDCYKKCHSPWPSNLLPSLQPKYMAPLNSPHKRKRVPEKHLFLLYWRRQSLWLCGSQQAVENSSRDGNTRPPYLPPEKFVCKSRSNS